MNKAIEKYVWFYLGVYVIVLLTFASFQYFGECEGVSLNCKTNWEKVKDILQTTAYMLTPIVAIIGFYAWKEQHNKNINAELGRKIWSNLDQISTLIDALSQKLNKFWLLSDEEFMQLKPYLINETRKINNLMMNVYLDVRLLDELLGVEKLTKIVTSHRVIKINEINDAVDIYQEISNSYSLFFYPIQTQIKNILIPIIRA